MPLEENIATLKLPRQVEIDPRREAVEKVLNRNLKPLWERGELLVPHVTFEPAFEKALIATLVSRHLERGLEHIEKLLGAEDHGIGLVREKAGAKHVCRISRLMIIADEGAERFYRTCESVLIRHSDRVLGIRVPVSCERFGQNLVGADKLVRVLLVSERDSVSNVLFSLVAQP